MWCFSCSEPSTKHDDPSEDHHKTTKKVSRHEEEDRIVRQKREKDEQIEIERATEISLKLFEEEEGKRRLEEESKEEDKRKQVDDDDQVDDEQIEIEKAKEISLKLFEQEEGKRRLEESKEEGKRKQVGDDGDPQVEEDKGQIKHSKDEDVNPPPSPSICNGRKSEIKDRSGSCLHCHKPIAVDEISRRGNFHKTCYKEQRHQQRHPNCCVCQKRIPSTEEGTKYNEHPFWKEKYCPCHDGDGTAKCCSCERLEPRGTNFVMLGDDRWLCLQCMESSVMDTYECHDLHMEIRDFFEGLFLKVEKEFPLLLVEKQALNKAEEEEKIDYHHALVTRGICLSVEQNVTSVSKGPKMGPNKQLIGMATESQRVVSECEVTAILILYGLPRLLTGYILAHEMMHAYLRLNGHRKLNKVLEEGLCQVLGHMWLESQTYATTDDAAASSAASSSSSRTPEENASKKGDRSEFEKKLVDFFKNQIETDDSPDYGEGFRKVNHMVTNSNLQEIVKEILRQG